MCGDGRRRLANKHNVNLRAHASACGLVPCWTRSSVPCRPDNRWPNGVLRPKKRLARSGPYCYVQCITVFLYFWSQPAIIPSSTESQIMLAVRDGARGHRPGQVVVAPASRRQFFFILSPNVAFINHAPFCPAQSRTFVQKGRNDPYIFIIAYPSLRVKPPYMMEIVSPYVEFQSVMA